MNAADALRWVKTILRARDFPEQDGWPRRLESVEEDIDLKIAEVEAECLASR